MTDNSPAIHRWVHVKQNYPSPGRGERIPTSVTALNLLAASGKDIVRYHVKTTVVAQDVFLHSMENGHVYKNRAGTFLFREEPLADLKKGLQPCEEGGEL